MTYDGTVTSETPRKRTAGGSRIYPDAKVTIILPTYDRARYLAQSLDSLLRQTKAPSQIIVVDDGSKDQTRQILAGYLDHLTVIEKENGGKPSAINAALPLVEGDYIWIFDDDDIACEDALERHLDVLETRRDVGFTYSGCYRCHDDSNTGELIIDGEYPVRPFSDDEYYVELMLSSYVASPAVVARTRLQLDAGEYATDLNRCEDLQMALRWGLIGVPARVEGQRPTYYRRHHAGDRGGPGDRFPQVESTRRDRDFERQIMRGSSAAIELRHFLPHSMWNTPMTEALEARARVRQWAIHMQKGMWLEAISMLESLAGLPLRLPAVAADLQTFGLRALGDKRAVDELVVAPETPAIAELLRKKELREVCALLGRQLYYHARGETRSGNFRALSNTLRAAQRLIVPTFLQYSPFSSKRL
jgi:glycosyltransferase involved in cell wall biosynthesis